MSCTCWDWVKVGELGSTIEEVEVEGSSELTLILDGVSNPEEWSCSSSGVFFLYRL